MSKKRNFFRDPFAFSLRGITATASYFIPPVIADDRINRAWDEKLRQDRQSPERTDNKERPGYSPGRRAVSGITH